VRQSRRLALRKIRRVFHSALPEKLPSSFCDLEDLPYLVPPEVPWRYFSAILSVAFTSRIKSSYFKL
jgi:hypothetical protein